MSKSTPFYLTRRVAFVIFIMAVCRDRQCPLRRKFVLNRKEKSVLLAGTRVLGERASFCQQQDMKSED